MTARDHAEGHRQASWLELLFDLSFVVAVAQAASQFEHFVAEGQVRQGLISYLLVFAAIWWAWVAFTWFANVFDVDDVPYRVLMMVMIAGSLGLAAGVPQLAQLDFRIGVASYVVMRLAYVAQWMRVWRTGDPVWKPVAARIIALTTINQIGWVFFLLIPIDWRVPVFLAWFAFDIATPIIARWNPRMGGHWGHIMERHGLFTIIVLGESIAAATIAVGHAIEVGPETDMVPLLILAAGGLVIVFSLWWIYFDFSTGRAIERGAAAVYGWAYGHYFLFAAIAAVGAGLALSVDWLTEPGHVQLPEWGVAMVPAGAIAAILVTIALIESLNERSVRAAHLHVKIAGGLFALAAAALAPVMTIPGSVLAIGLMLAAIVAYGVVLQHRLYTRTVPAESAAI